MKIMLVFALSLGIAAGSAGAPLPVLTDNFFVGPDHHAILRNNGKIRVYKDTGIGWIEDQNGSTYRVSGRDIKKNPGGSKKIKKGDKVTFDQKFKEGEWHALNVTPM